MPWFPEFVSAAELARRDIRTAGQADPVTTYFAALTKGDTHVLETVWPGEVVVYDPRAGEVRGHHQVRKFVRSNHAWLGDRRAGAETVASTRVGRRAVVELLAHLLDDEGKEVLWPIAVVAESSDDLSVVFRTYCSQWPVDGRRHLRASILQPAPATAQPGDVVARYQAALEAGDVDAIVSTFAVDGYFREPIGAHAVHRGAAELSAFFAQCFSWGGGIGLDDCLVTDDGARCAVEYNLVRWGSHDVAPQAGVAVFERGADGLIAAARVYDDVDPPGAGA
jgi:ketosteroid isomerase-like protein